MKLQYVDANTVNSFFVPAIQAFMNIPVGIRKKFNMSNQTTSIALTGMCNKTSRKKKNY